MRYSNENILLDTGKIGEDLDKAVDDTIRVVSFNIEYGASITRGYWQYLTSLWKYVVPHSITALEKVAELINRERINLCTFMEIDGGSFRTRNKNYLNILSQLTGLKRNVFFPVRRLLKFSNQGNGLLTKYEVLEARNIKLETHGENRYLSITRVKIGGKPVSVFTTQLALGHISRVKELKHIAQLINDTPGPIIFTGDLNTHSEKELDILRDTRLIRAETPQTFPSWSPSKRLDYLFYSPDFELLRTDVLLDLKVSDHLPIIAELKLKKK